ncbi:unnamed protein product [Protopolystoma xenopodis]|uniref:Uncharacterized protein n=1 Tax=Protopolystoma xenopodis TaxID=117903 RepID=A0A3S5BNV0_9PLAT|nr:unnamed protein product [Protopolystoma xenopodis]
MVPIPCRSRELRLINPERLADGRPCLYDIKTAFKDSTFASVIGTISLWLWLMLLWPGLGSLFGQFDFGHFSAWVSETIDTSHWSDACVNLLVSYDDTENAGAAGLDGLM